MSAVTHFKHWLTQFLNSLQTPECLYCSASLPDNPGLCDACLCLFGLRDGRRPIAALQGFPIHAACLFNQRLKRLIYGYKFNVQKQNKPLLIQLLLTYWQQVPLKFGLHQVDAASVWVVPIPSRHPRLSLVGQLSRGFSAQFGYQATSCLQWRPGVESRLPQHQLSSKRERFENVRGQLEVTGQALTAQKPKALLIVDDITTTGATLLEAYKVLRADPLFQDIPIQALAVCQIPLSLQTETAFAAESDLTPEMTDHYDLANFN